MKIKIQKKIFFILGKHWPLVTETLRISQKNQSQFTVKLLIKGISSKQRNSKARKLKAEVFGIFAWLELYSFCYFFITGKINDPNPLNLYQLKPLKLQQWTLFLLFYSGHKHIYIHLPIDWSAYIQKIERKLKCIVSQKE